MKEPKTIAMKKFKLLLLIVCCAYLTSCENEPVGYPNEPLITDEEMENPNEEEEESEEEPEEEPEYYTGGICIGNGEYGFNSANVPEEIIIPQELPDFYDLSEYLPPIMSQGAQGSCVSWAVSYYMKSLQENIQTGMPFNPANTMSPAYTYNQITLGNCVGTEIAATLQILKSKGVCSLDSFPYSADGCSEQPSAEQDTLASPNKISDFKNLSGENMVLEMKALINDQKPIIIGAYLSSEFGKIDDLGLTAYREHLVDYSLDRCHAMLVVGYSDEYSAFKVVNSWGENFGDDGFVWIDYKAFDNVIDSNAAFRVINQAYVAYDIE